MFFAERFSGREVYPALAGRTSGTLRFPVSFKRRKDENQVLFRRETPVGAACGGGLRSCIGEHRAGSPQEWNQSRNFFPITVVLGPEMGEENFFFVPDFQNESENDQYDAKECPERAARECRSCHGDNQASVNRVPRDAVRPGSHQRMTFLECDASAPESTEMNASPHSETQAGNDQTQPYPWERNVRSKE